MKRFVLDTSALLCYLRNEKGADRVLKILRDDSSLILMHRINLGEIYYGILRKDGEEKANEVYGYLAQYPIDFVHDLSDPFLVTASKMKASYGLGFADAFAAATAAIHNAVLVTKDNDFRILQRDSTIKIEWV